VNGLTDDVRLVGGSNVTVTPNSGDGTITISAAGSQMSSRRWKSDVRPLTTPLAKVRRLEGVRYIWTPTGEEQIGLIAEEVGRVLPDVVTYESNGVDARSVDYARLVALLIEAVKAQQDQLAAERAALDALRARVAALEQMMSSP
jgi:hypothetical protein